MQLPPPRHRRPRRPTFPAPRQPRPLLGPVPARAGSAPAQRRRTAGALAARDLRRPADRPRAHRRDRGPRDVRQLLRAHEYLRLKLLAVDLVILNEQAPSYVRTCRPPSKRWCAPASRACTTRGTRRSGERLLPPRRISWRRQSGTSCSPRPGPCSLSRDGTLAEQLGAAASGRTRGAAARRARDRHRDRAPPPRPELEFFNGLGGFADDGREYVTVLGEGPWTPAPWINVIANPGFGFQVSRSRAPATPGRRTAARTSSRRGPTIRSAIRRGRPSTSATKRRGELWGPTACRSARRPGPTSRATARATAGSSTPRTASRCELLQFVPLRRPGQDLAPLDRNRSGPAAAPVGHRVCRMGPGHLAQRRRRLSSSTEIDADTGALLARNAWNMRLRRPRRLCRSRRPADLLDRRPHGVPRAATATLDQPAALSSGRPPVRRVGAGLDPARRCRPSSSCARRARRDRLLPRPGGDVEEARTLIARYRERRPRRGACAK